MTKFFLPAAALDQHIAILGKTGSGKTFTAKAVVEHAIHQRRQVCVVDPTGAWWGLRLAADGRGRGLDVILLGGEHADIPLAERSGAAVARLVTEQGASVVIDTSGLTVGEYTRWFIDFAGTLYTTLKNPLHLVIDEAHYFMPQGRVPDVDAGKMLHAGNRLMSGGRSRGVRGLLVTQRPAKLHKDALTCADTLIAMRVIAPQDRQAIKDWIDGAGDPTQGKAVLDSLAQLKRGEGWVWYPEGGHLERVAFPPIATYDSSAAPRHGAKAGPEVGRIDLTEVRAALADAVREAEANDPKLLRKRVADLERQLRERPAAEVVREVRVEVPVLANGQLQEARGLVGQLEAVVGQVGEVAKSLSAQIARAVAGPVHHRPPPRPNAPVPRESPTARRVSAGTVSRPGPAGCATGLPRGERLILTAAAGHPGGVTREQLSVLTGFKRSSRDTYLQRLRTRGYVDGSGESIVATDAGVAALGSDFEPLPTGDALRDYWLGRLPEGERKILEVLIRHYPDEVDRESLGEATEYKRSSRDTYLQRLASRKLVVTGGRGTVKASPDLFG